MLVINERFDRLVSVAVANQRKSNSVAARHLYAGLMKDTHRYYGLIIAVLILIVGNKKVDLNVDLHQFDDFDYEYMLEETNSKITLHSIRAWFGIEGKINRAFKILSTHFKIMKRQGIELENIRIPVKSITKLDDASMRIIERMDGLFSHFQKFELKSIAKSVQAAFHWKLMSPKSPNKLSLNILG